MAVKKPKFTGSQKKSDYNGSRRRPWATNDWRKVLWSDESTSELWKIRGSVWVCRGKGF